MTMDCLKASVTSLIFPRVAEFNKHSSGQIYLQINFQQEFSIMGGFGQFGKYINPLYNSLGYTPKLCYSQKNNWGHTIKGRWDGNYSAGTPPFEWTGNMGCRVFKEGIQCNIFWAKNPFSWYFFDLTVASRQKLGIVFENKASQKLKLSKILLLPKRRAPTLTFFNKKKITKISLIFYRDNWLKVRFWHFLTTRNYVNL